MLVGFAFGALGMALSTFLRTWQDFDYVDVGQFALFLFSGTFAPPVGLSRRSCGCWWRSRRCTTGWS